MRNSIPFSHAPLFAVIALAACGDGASPASPRASTVVQVFLGDKQQVIAGGITAGPLIVRVAGSDAAGLPGVSVRWKSEGGTLLTYPDRHLMLDPVTRTDPYGQAGVYLRADLEGTLRVTATVGDVGLSAAFDIISTSPLDRTIVFGPFLCGRTPSRFYDAEIHADSSIVTVGALVTFELFREDLDGFQCSARLTSSRVPAGGESFETDTLRAGETAQFRPQVAGTWVIQDVMNGGEIRLTARNR